jgi:hypothetical protein
MSNSTNNIFDPPPASRTADVYGHVEPGSPSAAGLFEELTAPDHGHAAAQDDEFEQRYRAALADELESHGGFAPRRRRSLGVALPSRGLARQLVVGAICLIVAFLIASIAISLFHGTHREVNRAATTPSPTSTNVTPLAHRKAHNPDRAARPRKERTHANEARKRRGRHNAPRRHHAKPRTPKRGSEPRRQAVVTTRPAAPPTPAVIAPAPAPAPQPVYAPPTYAPPVAAPGPHPSSNSEFGFER